MSKQDLRKSLDALNDELAQLDQVDGAVKERMAQLINDIERQIDQPEVPEHRQNAQQTLPMLIEQFEAEHPQITKSLNRLLVTLDGMGI
ncbi:MAG: DUF4404 family protein [Synechococcales cyanobacterium RU_4_20]|nr:DUF4404 family protein [Synechococcales cyanobacterium RU_4_20]NJR68025.1 DUF4404 family protein [Synechococcales cyanobacterium CRU_2_2]